MTDEGDSSVGYGYDDVVDAFRRMGLLPKKTEIDQGVVPFDPLLQHLDMAAANPEPENYIFVEDHLFVPDDTFVVPEVVPEDDGREFNEENVSYRFNGFSQPKARG